MKKNTNRLTKTIRDKLHSHCEEIRTLADSMAASSDSVAVLEYGVQNLLYNCDSPTRAYIYSLVDTLLNAEQDVRRKSYINVAMVLSFQKYKSHIRAGTITKKLTDGFVAEVDKIDAPGIDKADIYRSVIMRLLMEIPSDKIDEFVQRLAPGVSNDKFASSERYMYG